MSYAELTDMSDMGLIRMYNTLDIHPSYAELFQEGRIDDVEQSLNEKRNIKLNDIFSNLSLYPTYPEQFQVGRIDKTRPLTEMISELSLNPTPKQISEEKAYYDWLIQTYGKPRIKEILNTELKKRKELLYSLQHELDNGMKEGGGGQQGHRNRSGSRRKRTAHQRRKNHRKSKRVRHTRRKHTRRHRHSRSSK